MPRFHAVCYALVAGVLLFANTPSRAEPAGNDKSAKDSPHAKLDPKAKAVIDRFGKFFAGLKGFRTLLLVQIKSEAAGQKMDFSATHHIAAERPNKFSLEVESSVGGHAVVKSDGKNLSIYMGLSNKYLVNKAPERWSGLSSNPFVAGIAGMGNSGVVTTSIIQDDPAKAVLANVESLAYVGVDDVDGVKCDHLTGTQPEMDWEIWIEQGDRPLVHKFVPDLAKTLKKLANQPGGPKLEGWKIENVVRYTQWEIDPKFAPDTFVFTPPQDATEVDSLMALLRPESSSVGQGPHPLLGKVAPDFKLDLLDGKTLHLADHKGKDVVILDFWATWCGPCRQAMPIIDKVAETYRGKGVVLYTVNLHEEADAIREALDTDKLQVTVAMDRDGKVGRLYKADAIPQTVIVGKDGTVQVVHVGLLPDLEKQLRDELDALVAGKTLAEPPGDDSQPVSESPDAKEKTAREK